MVNFKITLLLAGFAINSIANGQPVNGTTTFTGNVGTVASLQTGLAGGNLNGWTFALTSSKKADVSNTGNNVNLTSSPAPKGYWGSGVFASVDNSAFKLLNFDFEVNSPTFVGLTATITGMTNFTAVPGATITVPITAANQYYFVDVSGIAAFNNVNEIQILFSPSTGVGSVSIKDITIDKPILLPVVWEGPVTAVLVKGHPLVSWAVSSQVDNNRFVVQRSGDAVHFGDIGTVRPTDAHVYAFADLSAMPGANYYRIKQVDLDGDSTFSNTTGLTLWASNAFSAYPNPTTGPLTVVASEATAVLQLTDLSGQVILVRRGPGSLDLSSLAAGVYLLHSQKDRSVLKIIKK